MSAPCNANVTMLRLNAEGTRDFRIVCIYDFVFDEMYDEASPADKSFRACALGSNELKNVVRNYKMSVVAGIDEETHDIEI